MKLYTNGCSFTQGTYPFTHPGNPPYEDLPCQRYNDYTYFAEQQDFVWPWILGKDFDLVFNHGKMSTGFDRTVRTTLEFLESLDPKEYHEWIFIIQPSLPERKEYIYDNGKIGQVCLPHPSDPYPPTVMFHTHNHNLDFLNELSFEDEESKALINYHMLFQNPSSLRYDQYKNILMLQQILKSKGIKYLYCPLQTGNCNINNQNDNIDCINLLVNNIDSDTIIPSMSLMLTEETGHVEKVPSKYFLPNDNHPNALGNKVIAEHIKTELEKRNWLT